MKEYTKKQLDRIIRESMSDVDEMAYKVQNKQAPQTDKETGEKKIKKFSPRFRESNPTEVPDYWIVNVNQIEGEDVLAVPLGCDKLEDFVQSNKQWLEELKVLHKLEPQLIACTRGKYHRPVEKYYAGGYKPTGEKYSAQEWAKRIVHPMIENILGNEQTQKRLEELSIPEIYAKKREYLDRYGKNTETEVNYSTHTFNSYESQQQFLDFVTARVFGEEVPEQFKSYHLARQFNKNYANWEETKKNDKRYFGKTPKYKLEAFGFDQGNLDVTVRADLSIKGRLIGFEYRWEVIFSTKFGRKLKEESRIKNGLSLDKDLVVRKVIPVSTEEEFNAQHTVLHNDSIRLGLEEALEELRDKFFNELDPIEVLERANIRSYDVGNIQESKYKKTLRRIINEPLRK
jgi:hypothetical protein